MENDHDMVLKQWQKPREYLNIRNYKYETILHVAAKKNSRACLEALLQKVVFISHMLKKDYEGNTAIHIAAKAGSLDMLEFLLSSCTSGFLEIQNDFGFDPLQAC
jgi:ankyrin repeat protein